LRCAPLFRGFRGRPAGDLEAAAYALAALSQLATRADLGVLEAEINPLIVGERGVAAVDAVVRVAPPSGVSY
jgi:succinyl-CoA synthetase beta subunit